MKRSTGCSRMASRSTCVPTTLVVTNSAPPSSIDLETWDSAAALTMTSTPSSASLTSAASRVSPLVDFERVADVGDVADVALDELQTLVAHHVVEVGQVARVREGVHGDHLVVGGLE